MKDLIQKAEALYSEILGRVEVDVTPRAELSSLVSSLQMTLRARDALRAAEAGQADYAVAVSLQIDDISDAFEIAEIDAETADGLWEDYIYLFVYEISDHANIIFENSYFTEYKNMDFAQATKLPGRRS